MGLHRERRGDVVACALVPPEAEDARARARAVADQDARGVMKDARGLFAWPHACSRLLACSARLTRRARRVRRRRAATESMRLPSARSCPPRTTCAKSSRTRFPISRAGFEHGPGRDQQLPPRPCACASCPARKASDALEPVGGGGLGSQAIGVQGAHEFSVLPRWAFLVFAAQAGGDEEDGKDEEAGRQGLQGCASAARRSAR